MILREAGVYRRPRKTLGVIRKGDELSYLQTLHPYLLFDAQTSMIGTLENPTLDLDPSKPDTLNVITATRAGAATYTDASGVIQAASPNTVRVDHVAGVPMILVEPAATNLVDDSTSFDIPGDITKTSGIDAPDGTNTATKISGILSSSSSDMAYSKALTVASSTQVTGSIHVRGIAGEVVVIRTKRHSGGGYIASDAQEVTLTENWQRVEGLTMTLRADNTNCSISIRKEGGSTADSVDIWGGQIETGTVATSYIATSGSTVTRAKDDLVITGSDFTNFYNQSEGTFYVEYVMGTDTGQPFVIDVDNGDDNRIIIYNANGNNLVKFIKSLGTSTVSDTIDTRSPVGALSRVALSYATNNVQASQDGGNVVTDTSATIPTNINRLSIGSRYGQSSVYKLNGHIKRLLYWPLHSDSL